MVSTISNGVAFRTSRRSARSIMACTLVASTSLSALRLCRVTCAASSGARRAEILAARSRTASSMAAAPANVEKRRSRRKPLATRGIITNKWGRPCAVPFFIVQPRSSVCDRGSRHRTPQNVVCEEELSVVRNHHDLHLVGKLLGNDLLNQQRVLLQDFRLEFHPLRVGVRDPPDTVIVAVAHQPALFKLGFAVDDLGLRQRLGVLDRGFLARLCLQPRLLDLLLLERQCVLHCVRLGLGFEYHYLCSRFGLFHFTRFLGLGLEFRGLHHLALYLEVDVQSLVFLFLQQQAFQALRVFSRKQYVPQHDFLDDNSVGAEPGRDPAARYLADLITFG